MGEVKLVVENGIARMYLSNPARKNALNLSMWEAISEHCAQLYRAGNVRVVALSGVEGNFASGADISELSGDRFAHVHTKIEAALTSLEGLPMPVVGILEGYVLGGGLELAAACDLRICSDNAKLGIPAAKRGIGITQSNTQRLVHLIGPAKTMELLFTGETFSPAKALSWGLVNDVVPQAELENRAAAMLNLLVQNAPLSLKATKHNVRSVWLGQAHEMEDPAELCYHSEDLKEGLRAFAEKRTPNFTGH